MIHIQEHLSDSEVIIKDSIFLRILFVIHTLMSSFVIGFYDYKCLLLYNRCCETFHINNQTIPHFVNLRSKKIPVSISYPSTANPFDGYMDARVSPTSVWYIISRYK